MLTTSQTQLTIYVWTSLNEKYGSVCLEFQWTVRLVVFQRIQIEVFGVFQWAEGFRVFQWTEGFGCINRLDGSVCFNGRKVSNVSVDGWFGVFQ